MKLILFVVFAGLVQAQVPVPNPMDQWIVVVQRVKGQMTAIGTFTVPTQPLPACPPVVVCPPPTPPAPLATTAAWLLLAPSPSDPLTWCATPLAGVTFTPSLLHEYHNQVQPPAPDAVFSPAVYTYDFYGDIQPAPNVAPGGVNPTSIPPQWIKTACGGNPGVVFQANVLQPGETRVRVLLRVTY